MRLMPRIEKWDDYKGSLSLCGYEKLFFSLNMTKFNYLFHYFAPVKYLIIMCVFVCLYIHTHFAYICIIMYMYSQKSFISSDICSQ